MVEINNWYFFQGGIIAKGSLLLAPNMNASFASMIINLASPSILYSLVSP